MKRFKIFTRALNPFIAGNHTQFVIMTPLIMKYVNRGETQISENLPILFLTYHYKRTAITAVTDILEQKDTNIQLHA